MKRLLALLLLSVWGLCALAVEKSPTIVYINGAKYYIHTIQPGETLYGISKAYEVAEKVILENNPSLAQGLKAQEAIKIPLIAQVVEQLSDRKLQKLFEVRTVAKGETLYGLSRKYEIPVNTIIEDNPGLDPAHLREGERILLRKRQIGTGSEAQSTAQWEEYRASLSSVAEPGYTYHIVQPGETFYSLARRFGITEQQLSDINAQLKSADLKAGAMLKVPGDDVQVAAPQPETVVVSIPQAPPAEVTPPIAFHALQAGETLDVALMLPMAVGTKADNNYLEFYQGFLLGLDSVRMQYGCSVNLTLYNTGRDAERIRGIVRSSAFEGTDLIVGPVYEEGLTPVVHYAEEHRIPVVSPLANLTSVHSETLFQLAPDPTYKYAKVADLLSEAKHVTLIYAESTDTEFEQEILAALGSTPHAKHTYRYVHPSMGKPAAGGPSDLSVLLDNDDDNVFVILADKEVDVDRILAAIASADTNLTARSRATPRFVVLGNARWNRYNNIDREMFFKDRVVFVSTYHAKRDAQVVAAFDNAYIRTFGTLPTLYSYRGYDAAAMFVPAMYNDIEYDMQGRTFTPLQTAYVFSREESRSNHVNRNWMRVNYNTDFTITVE